MKILVTGGAGYIGSTLVPLLLASGHRVRVLDSLLHGGDPLLGVWSHPHFEFIRGDIRDRKAIRASVSSMDAVVHLAAIVGDPACAREPSLARAVNLEASMGLIQASQRHGIKRFLFASTCSNYGKMQDSSAYLNEESELRPVSLYAETKVSVETALLKGSGRRGWHPTPLRFATIFGVSPRMRFDLTVNEFVMEMLLKKKLEVFGEQFWRPYVHVRDAALAIQLVLESPTSKVSGQVFNVGSTKQNFQKQQLVDLILPHVPDAEVKFVRRDEDPRDYRVSFSKIKDQLGFQITSSVERGIEEIVHLLRNNVVNSLGDAKYRN
jgi:nucleoside-diphosphate-sugar epimerase